MTHKDHSIIIIYFLQSYSLSTVAISSREPSYGLSDISTETINFEGLLNITDSKTIEAELVNKYEY